MHIALALALALTPDPTSVPEQADAVVRLGGCSGVIVHPAGLILSADHCGLPGSATLDDGTTRSVVSLYDPPQDGIDQASLFAIDPPGEYPYVAVARTRPDENDLVYSIGWPAEGRNRAQWEMHRGRIVAVDVSRGNPHVEDGIIADFPVWGGNSGGPLFNEHGELIGICSQSDRRSRSVWIGPDSIENALAQCPEGRCPPPGSIRIGPPIEVELPRDDPAPLPPPKDDPQLPPRTPDAPRGPPAPPTQMELPVGDIVMLAATVAGVVFGLPMLPRFAGMLLSVLGIQVTRTSNRNGTAADG